MLYLWNIWYPTCWIIQYIIVLEIQKYYFTDFSYVSNLMYRTSEYKINYGLIGNIILKNLIANTKLGKKNDIFSI